MKLAFVCVALAACTPKPAPQPPAEPWQMTGGLEHGMMNCPSAVDGAHTRLRMTARGVNVIVTSKDPTAAAEITALAEFHARQDRFTEWPAHSGFHGGPGKIGHCPVIHDRTQIVISALEDGVIMHVTALVPEHVQSVQDQTAQRLAALPKWLPRSGRR